MYTEPYEFELNEIELDQCYFVGACTCDHGQLEHGLGACLTDNCKCKAGWEENKN